MTSQADSPSTGSQAGARGALGLMPDDPAAYPFVRWKSAWQELEACQVGGQRLILLLGNPGCGKSTMLESFAASLGRAGKSCVRLQGAQVESQDFLVLTAISLGLDPEACEPLALEDHLRKRLQARSKQRELYLLVDDADMLGTSALASMMRLADLVPHETSPEPAPDFEGPDSGGFEIAADTDLPTMNSSAQKLVDEGKVDSGKPHIDATAGRPRGGGLRVVLAAPTRLPSLLGECQVDLRNSSKVAIVTLGPLEEREAFGYLLHFLARSPGAEGTKMSSAAAKAIHGYARGIPRVASRITSRLLLDASLRGSNSISPDDVVRVAADLQSEGLLNMVSSAPEPGSEGDRQSHVPDSELTADPELEAAIGRSLATQADTDQFDWYVGPSPPGVFTPTQSPESKVLAAVPHEGPISDRASSRARLFIPLLGTAVVLSVLTAGWQYWADIAPSNPPAISAMLAGAGDRVAAIGQETNPLAGDAPGSTGEAPSSLVVEAPESVQTTQQPSTAGEVAPRSTTSDQTSVPNAADTEIGRLLSYDSTSPGVDPALGQASQRVGPPVATDKPKPVVTGENPAGGFDTAPQTATLEGMVQLPARSDRVLARGSEVPVTGPALPTNEVDETSLTEAPEELANTADAPGSASALPKPGPLDELAWSREREPATPEGAPVALAYVQSDPEPPRTATPELGSLADDLSAGEADWEQPSEARETLPVLPEPRAPMLVVTTTPAQGTGDDKAPPGNAAGPDEADAGALDPSPVQTTQQDGTTTSTAGEIASLQTLEAHRQVPDEPRLEQLLRAATLDMQNNRLTKPDGNNAFERFSTVLEIDPENSEAQNGLEAIVDAYVNLLGRARADGKPERAALYLGRAEMVLPESPKLVELRREMGEEFVEGAGPVRLQTGLPTATQTVASTLERVVVLPVRTGEACAWPFDEHMIGAVRKVIEVRAPGRLTLTIPKAAGNAGGPPGNDFWLSATPNGLPDEQQIYPYGKRLGARWVVLSQVDCPSSASVFEPWRDFQIYLFDVEQGVSHRRAGTIAEIGPITEQMLLTNIAAVGG